MSDDDLTPRAAATAAALTFLSRRARVAQVALVIVLAAMGIMQGFQQNTISTLTHTVTALNQQATADKAASKPLVRIIVREGATITGLQRELAQTGRFAHQIIGLERGICRSVHCHVAK